jgi:hypothetical protein
MTENKLIFGIVMIIIGLILFYFFIIREYGQNKDAWGLAMYFKGLVGSLSFILIGIVSLLIYFGIF